MYICSIAKRFSTQDYMECDSIEILDDDFSLTQNLLGRTNDDIVLSANDKSFFSSSSTDIVQPCNDESITKTWFEIASKPKSYWLMD
jgi:hypothetical protein